MDEVDLAIARWLRWQFRMAGLFLGVIMWMAVYAYWY